MIQSMLQPIPALRVGLDTLKQNDPWCSQRCYRSRVLKMSVTWSLVCWLQLSRLSSPDKLHLRHEPAIHAGIQPFIQTITFILFSLKIVWALCPKISWIFCIEVSKATSGSSSAHGGWNTRCAVVYLVLKNSWLFKHFNFSLIRILFLPFNLPLESEFKWRLSASAAVQMLWMLLMKLEAQRWRQLQWTMVCLSSFRATLFQSIFALRRTSPSVISRAVMSLCALHSSALA